MFTGIIESVSEVLRIEQREQGMGLVIKRPEPFNDIEIGDSISVNGVCLTVTDFTNTSISFFAGFETLRITNWDQDLRQGFMVNTERAMPMGARVHGHIVQGHVDQIFVLSERTEAGDSTVMTFEVRTGDRDFYEKPETRVPSTELPYVFAKGSISVNGVSLTVNELVQSGFKVCIIPHTWSQTNLHRVQVGDPVLVEFDILTKAAVDTVRRVLGPGSHFRSSGLF